MFWVFDVDAGVVVRCNLVSLVLVLFVVVVVVVCCLLLFVVVSV